MNNVEERNPIDWQHFSEVVKLRGPGPFPEKEFLEYRRAYLSRLSPDARRRFIQVWGGRGAVPDLPAKPRLAFVPEDARSTSGRPPKPAVEDVRKRPGLLPVLDPKRARLDLLKKKWKKITGGDGRAPAAGLDHDRGDEEA